MWTVTYTHDRAHGFTYSFTVEAPDEESAKMIAGMFRADSFTGWWTKRFWTSPVKWEILSVERLS